ncbi:MAG: hypothetical protein WBB70_17030 [Desulfobacterales bacterium]
MAKRPNIFKDRDKIIIEHQQEQGKPRKIEEYWTVRGGISWPTTTTPGYYCLFGLKDEPTTTDKKPLVLLAEGKAQLPTKFFEKVAVSSRRLCCDRLYADLDDHHKGLEDSFRKFVREGKIEGIRLLDSSEFFDIDHGSLLIKQWKRDGALIVPKRTILRDQLETVSGDITLSDLEKDFYAIAALIRVLISFEIYPWSKPSKQFAGFSNWKQRIKTEKNTEYEEYYVD